jgi:hypothetical protein
VKLVQFSVFPTYITNFDNFDIGGVMVDIAKCASESCRVRRRCWRWVSPASVVQTYADFPVREDGVCDYFIEIVRRGEKK